MFPEFITVTCLEWKPLLESKIHKEVIVQSLDFLTKDRRALVYAFVIMKNHFHLIWQMLGDHQRENVQRAFLKFTGQQILKNLRNTHSDFLQEVVVDAKDRKRQVWERNSLGIPLWTKEVFMQKLEYIHNNPVKAVLCLSPKEYPYSSAEFYILNKTNWKFLTHYDG